MSAHAEVELRRRRWTVDEYERMARTGVLHPDDRVELLEGEIVAMTPIGPTHASIVDRLNRLFVRLAGDRAIVRVQHPLRIAPHSEPEPDLVIAHPRDDFFASGHPTPAEVFLAVEVADSSLSFDRAVKVPLYARAGVPVVWLVDVQGRAVHVHAEPAGGTYRRVSTAGRGGQLSVRIADTDHPVAVGDVVG